MSVDPHKELEEILKKAPYVSFKNEHGEVFNLHLPTQFIFPVVFMSGDEVDMMVEDKHKFAGKYVGLFGNDFNMWTPDELTELGKALQKLAKKAKEYAH